jgi:hypothetical protein
MANVKFLKEFRGGSMARTYLIGKQGNRYVRKIASNNGELAGLKLKSQYDWIADFNRKYPDILPKVSFFVIDKETCHYDMEHIEMGTFRDYLMTSPGYDSTLVHDILNYGSVIASVDTKHKEKKEDYIKNKHLNKMIDRCEIIKDHPIYTSDYLTVNGKKLKNIKALVSEIAGNKNLMDLLKPKKWYRSHGDFTFQNILTDEEEVRIIDPRGEGPDSVYYDISKIFQSCHGKYDLLVPGNYQIKAQQYPDGEVTVDYKILNGVEKMDNVFEQVKDLIPDYYKIEDEHWEIITKFFEGSHFISMTPFRAKENTEITFVCYAIGIQILNEMLEEFYATQS